MNALSPPSWSISNIAIGNVPAYVRPVDLPLSQQIALVTLNRFSELSGKVIDALFAAGHKRATYVDFSALVTLEYAWKPEGESFHRITPRGKTAADDVAQSLARGLDIHHFVTSGAGGRFEHSLRCTCGWGCGLSLNQGHMAMAARYAMSKHLADVARLKEAVVVVVAVPGVVS